MQAFVSMVMGLWFHKGLRKYSPTVQRLTSAEGFYCKHLVKNSVEDITWTQENNVVKKLRRWSLVKTCNIQIILLLRCLNKE